MNISLKDRVYRHVRSKIVHGTLAPGDRLSHRALAKEVGVSYTPVREAISLLASEGLVECHARRGTFVSVLGRKDIADMFDLRAAIETYAMEKLAGNISAEALGEVRAINQQLRDIFEEVKQTDGSLWVSQEARIWMRSDLAIHLTLLCAAGNPRPVKTIQDMHLPHVAGQSDQAPSLEGLEFAITSHEALFQALEQGEGERARKLVARHIEHGYTSTIKALEAGHFGKIKDWEGPERELPATLARRIRMLEMGF
ncbi:MAG: GntR family transcriptional regulator [Pirellulales bacterium]|nr:GntR family transcriptional regulator [Pirellulales bacterium]